MDKETIINKIISEAKEDAKNRIKQAEDEIEVNFKAEMNLLEEYKEKKLIEANKLAKQIHENEISAAELKARNMILNQKQKIIKETKQKINDKLYALDGEEYVAFIMQILKNTGLINVKGAKIILPLKQREEIAKALNSVFEISDEKADFSGGFILKKGNVEYNYVLDTILEMEKDLFDDVLVKELF